MSPRHFCTYFDHNYIPRALVMLESLFECYPEAILHIICLTQECFEAMKQLSYPFLRLYSLCELESADPQLAATRDTRSLIEYYFTLTPCLPLFLLRHQGLPSVTYLDADMIFFSSPAPLFDEAPDADVLITPHRFSPRLAELERFGLYNVSWMTFCNTPNGMKCLEWYRAACLEWCFDRVEDDRFADQKYLDAFSRLFTGVHAIEHKGAGVAPWNIAEADVHKEGGLLMAGDAPLIFYHAQAFHNIAGPFYSSGCRQYKTPVTAKQKELIFKPYAQLYRRAVKKAKKLSIRALKAGPRLKQAQGGAIGIYRQIRKEWKASSLIVQF